MDRAQQTGFSWSRWSVERPTNREPPPGLRTSAGAPFVSRSGALPPPRRLRILDALVALLRRLGVPVLAAGRLRAVGARGDAAPHLAVPLVLAGHGVRLDRRGGRVNGC